MYPTDDKKKKKKTARPARCYVIIRVQKRSIDELIIFVADEFFIFFFIIPSRPSRIIAYLKSRTYLESISYNVLARRVTSLASGRRRAERKRV